MDKVTVSLVAPALPCFPVWVAHDTGIFEERDILYDEQIAGATDRVLTSIKHGEAQIGIGPAEGVVADAAAGGSTRLLGSIATMPPLALVAQPWITSIDGLRGRRIGTSSLGEGTATLIRKIMASHGLQYPRDYDLAVIGAHPARWQALQSGAIDACLQLTPFDLVAEEAGFTKLAVAGQYVPHYVFSALLTDLAWAEDHRDVTVRFLAALRDATAWTTDNIPDAAELVSRAAGLPAAHTERALAQLFQDGVAAVDRRIEEKDLQAVFDMMHEIGFVAGDVVLRYEACVDGSFMAALSAVR